MTPRLVGWSGLVRSALCFIAMPRQTILRPVPLLQRLSAAASCRPSWFPVETHVGQLGSMLGSNRNNRIPDSVVAQRVGVLVSDLAINEGQK